MLGAEEVEVEVEVEVVEAVVIAPAEGPQEVMAATQEVEALGHHHLRHASKGHASAP